MLIIYTDGSARKNGSSDAEGGFGVLVCEGTPNTPETAWNIVDVYAEQVQGTTNNRMEMSAILWALEHYGADKDAFFLPLVFTDSQYSLKSFTLWRDGWKNNGWTRPGGKELENKDLIMKYDDLIKEKKIDLQYVKGHSETKGNIIADLLATGKITSTDVLINGFNIIVN